MTLNINPNSQQTYKTKSVTRRIYSKPLGEYYTEFLNGSIVFDSGVEYTKREREYMRNKGIDKVKAMHITKLISKEFGDGKSQYDCFGHYEKRLSEDPF